MAPRVMVIQTAWLGDLILTTPLFRAIKKQWPEAETTVVVTPSSAPLLEGLSDVDDLIVHDKRRGGWADLRRVLRDIASRRADVLISPHRSARSSLLALASGAPTRAGYRENAFPWVYNRRVRRPMERHETERILALGEKIGIIGDSGKPRLAVSAAERAGARAHVGEKRVAVVSPSSAWATKRWTPDGFAAVTDWLGARGYAVALTGSPGDRDLCAEVAARSRVTPFNVAGVLSLREVLALIEGAEVLVANDSAPVHMASAFDTPTVAVFGATVPAQGFGPLATRSEVAEVAGLSCRPCGAHGSARCPQKHFKCMLQLTPARVIASLERVLP